MDFGMSLSNRDRAKVNAALVMIRDAGHNPEDVTRIAQSIINTGAPTRQAYERAFNQFVEQVPAFLAPMQRLGQLIENTDLTTLARYNVGLERYIETGDAAALQSIMPTVQQDMATMAARSGDAGYADGLDPAPATPAAPAAAAPAPVSNVPPPVQPPARPGWGSEGFSPAQAQP